MRVLLLSLNWVEYLVEIGNALAARGHQVDIIVKTGRVRQTVGDALPQLVAPGVRVHLVDDRPRGLRDPRQFHTIARLSWLLRRLRPDVIHLHRASNTYLPFCFQFARGVPMVMTIHDVTAHPGEDSEQPGRRQRVRDFLNQRAAAFILHGEWLRDRFLEQTAVAEERVHSIPHGCYSVFRHWAEGEVEEVPGSVLFFGRIHEYKGLAYLLEASKIVAEQVPGYRLIIAGAGRNLEQHRAELAEHPYAEVHEGYLTNAEVTAVFRKSSLIVLPYIEGSQSGVVRIGYVFGKPAIVTAVGSIPESVQDGVTGRVIPPRDTEALAAAMVELLADRGKLRRMSEAAAAMPETDFSWARIAERTEGVYRQVTGG